MAKTSARTRTSAAVVAMAMMAGGAGTAAAAPVVSELPTPPAQFAWAGDVSTAGAVGTYGTADGSVQRAIHWAPDGTATTLPLLPGTTTSSASGTNRHGVVIGHSGSSVVRWAADGTVTALRLPGGRPYGLASAVNDRGVVAGVAHRGRPDSRVAVRWSPRGVPSVLPSLPGSTESDVEDIAQNGTIVGEALLSDGNHRAVRWNPDGAVAELATLPGGARSWVSGINARNVIVGTAADSEDRLRPVRWNPDGTITRLAVPAGASSATPHDVNDRGVVVGQARIDGRSVPIRWNVNGTITVLPSLDQRPAAAKAISPHGVIVGSTDHDFLSPDAALRWTRP